MHNQQKTKHGFTIIEVVLVLAIAGLIFMMVFLALPALQRSQRDTQRRDDMSRFLAQINQYQANNRGNVPTKAGEHKWTGDDASTDWGKFHSGYLVGNGDDFTDPGGDGYWVKDEGTVTSDKTLDVTAVDYFIHVYHGATCTSTEGKVTKATNSSARKIAIMYKLEGAGIYCGES